MSNTKENLTPVKHRGIEKIKKNKDYQIEDQFGNAIDVPNITLPNNVILLTMSQAKVNVPGLVMSGEVLDDQVVVAAGPGSYKEGDFVRLNFAAFQVKVAGKIHEEDTGTGTRIELRIPTTTINGVKYYRVAANHLDFKWNKEEA